MSLAQLKVIYRLQNKVYFQNHFIKMQYKESAFERGFFLDWTSQNSTRLHIILLKGVAME